MLFGFAVMRAIGRRKPSKRGQTVYVPAAERYCVRCFQFKPRELFSMVQATALADLQQVQSKCKWQVQSAKCEQHKRERKGNMHTQQALGRARRVTRGDLVAEKLPRPTSK